MNRLTKILATRVLGFLNVFDFLMWAVLTALYSVLIPVIGIGFVILLAVVLSLASAVVSVSLETRAKTIS